MAWGERKKIGFNNSNIKLMRSVAALVISLVDFWTSAKSDDWKEQMEQIMPRDVEAPISFLLF